MIREKIAGIRADEIGRPVGAYRVELCDRHTGRVLERVDTHNYITPVYERWIRWWQGRMFNATIPYVHEGSVTYSPGSLGGLDRPPPMPIHTIVGLDSELAENTASSWATGRTVGFGHRWRANISSSGKRGQINETQCVTTPDLIRYVWDFNENQGNGTYASFAIAAATAGGDLVTSVQLPRLAGLQAALATSPAWLGLYLAGSDATSIYGFYASATNNFRAAVFSWSDFDASTATGVRSYTGTPVEFQLSGIANTGSGAGNNVMQQSSVPAICMDGANYLFAHIDGHRNLYLSRFTSAGTRTHVVTVQASGDSSSGGFVSAGVAVHDGFAYVVANVATTNVTNDKIYKIDLSSFSVDATIPLAGSARINHGGVAVIGGLVFVHTNDGGIHAYSAASGAFVEAYGHAASGPYSETGLAPFPSGLSFSYGTRGTAIRDALKVVAGSGTRTGGDDPDMRTGSALGYLEQSDAFLLGDGSRLWSARGRNVETAAVINGDNCWSRAVLDIPVAKNNTQTMKWTYELTLPEEWRAIPDHLPPPLPA